jgi:hypothetical protein
MIAKKSAGRACGDDRNDPVPREFLHEQISKTGFMSNCAQSSTGRERSIPGAGQAFKNLADNEEWVTANRDRIISNRAPADGRIGYGVAEDRS